MSHAQKREEWRILAEKNTDPEWGPSQLELLREGATLEQLSEVVAVRYSIFRNWIRADAEREVSLAEAKREGKTRQMERVLQTTFDTALSSPADPVRHSDKLRAIEILLKPTSTIAISGEKTPSGIQISFVDAENGKPAG